MMILSIGIGIGLVLGLWLGIRLGLRTERRYQTFLREVQQHKHTQSLSRYYITREGIRDASKDYSEF